MWFFHSMNLVCMGTLTIIISTNFVNLVQDSLLIQQKY